MERSRPRCAFRVSGSYNPPGTNATGSVVPVDFVTVPSRSRRPAVCCSSVVLKFIRTGERLTQYYKDRRAAGSSHVTHHNPPAARTAEYAAFRRTQSTPSCSIRSRNMLSASSREKVR